MSEFNKNFLTKGGLEQIKKELEQLKNVKRKEISRRIQEAKELGDLSENAEYAEAKNEQAFVEGRIIELEHVLKNVVIIQNPKNGSQVAVGSKLKIKAEDNVIKEYIIVGSKEADPEGGKISNVSPLGRAFLGKKVGDKVTIQVPKGETQYQIIKIF